MSERRFKKRSRDVNKLAKSVVDQAILRHRVGTQALHKSVQY